MVAGIVIRDLARAEAIAAVQAHAALKIDAAEHALNRIAADCAKLITTAEAPKLRRRLTHRPEPYPPIAA